MSDAIQFNSRVGDDGMLNLQIDLGQAGAKKEVVVTIEPLAADTDRDAESLDWHKFIERTYGSCAGLGLERHEQGQFDEREPIA
jgi:hypothetical protein